MAKKADSEPQQPDAADVLRQPDAISATHHAGMLARLRGRAHPTLDDIHDALVTCCCKGNPAEEGTKLQEALDAAGIGNKIGKVTSALGRLPIVNDFHSQLADLDLGEVLGKEKRLATKLDKRDPLAARRSAFLHRLKFLEIPFAVMSSTGGDFSGTLFREDRQLKWDPKTEPALIEQNGCSPSVAPDHAAFFANCRAWMARGGTVTLSNDCSTRS